MRISKHTRIIVVIFTIIIMSGNITTVKADSFPGGFSSVKNFKYLCTRECNYWIHGANAWNNISTKVNSSRHYGQEWEGHARLTGSTTNILGLLGEIFPYTSYGVGVDPVYDQTGTGTWVFAVGVLYTNNLNSNEMKNGVAIHEFGHILSQAHTSNTSSCMYPYYSTYKHPSIFDKNSLKTKWGN